MSVRLALAERWVPAGTRRRGLAELVERTARAFEVPAPDVGGETAEGMLRRFASFTRDQAARALASPAQTARARDRLRLEAREFGLALRGRLGVRSRPEALRAARVLYRMLGIDLSASLSGSITVRTCGFAATYGCDTCALMAAMDEGLFAGLVGEGRLEFATRLTEGAGRCVAFFTFEGESR